MATAPTNEIGSVEALPGWTAFMSTGSEVGEPAAWIGPQRVATVNRMRADAQVDSLSNSVVMPVMRMTWQLNPNGASDEIVQQISTDLGIPIKGNNDPAPRSRRRFKHRDHLEHALLALWYGHMFFEQVPDTENFDLATDGWRLRKLAPRMPGSIQSIHTARDGGLEGITQFGYRPPTNTRRGLSLIGSGAPQISVNSLAAYVWKREGANWSGRSMLRPLYRDWILKDRALRVDAMKNERFGLGIPTATAAPGGDPAQYARLAQEMRASEFGGVGLANGATVGVEGVRGTLPDVMASIRYYDESMARSFMAMVVQLGQTQTGSRALGETFADFFQMLVEAVANWYRDATNEHVINDLVDWNFGEDEQAPEIEWSYPQGEQTLAISELVSMVSSGVITMDVDTERAVRQRTRLPAIPEVDEVEDVQNAASSPFSSVGLPALVQSAIISPDEARDLLGMLGPAPTPAQISAAIAALHPHRSRTEIDSAVSAATGGRKFAARKQTLGDNAIGHREANPFELAAGTDFETLQKTWEDATEDLITDWKKVVQGPQIDALVEQVRAAVAANDLVALSQLQAPVAGVELLTEQLKNLAEDAIVGAKAEAASQGVSIGTVNTATKVEPLVAQRAEATANLLSRGISESASRAAMNLGAGVAPEVAAAAVREHLEGLTDAYLQDMLGGAMTQAQNTGRKAVFSEQPSVIYASELLDMNTCERCAEVDGKRYDDLAAAELDYPTGGNKNCLGGPRCRGTLVAVYGEGDDAVPPPAPEAEPTGIGEIPEGFGGVLSGEGGKAANRWVELRKGKGTHTGSENLDDRTTRFDYKDGSLKVTNLGDREYRVEWDEKNFKPGELGGDVTTSLTPTRAENRALGYYQGSYNFPINKGLRGLPNNVTDPGHVAEQIDALDNLMARSFTTSDTVVYRGGKIPDNLSVGQTFTDRGFVSTSTDSAVADRFTEGAGNQLLEINVPEGSPGVFLEKRSAGKSEAELLLDRDTQFRVVEIREDRVVLEAYRG